MKELQIKTDSEIKFIFDSYPDLVRKRLLALRELIIETATTTEGVTTLEETLKWGEPSYLTKNGSTIRINWKSKTPDQYAIYFQCTSKLVPTFKMVYKNVFRFDKKRAIIFQLDEKIPKSELKTCIKTALTYHKVKHLLTLGM